MTGIPGQRRPRRAGPVSPARRLRASPRSPPVPNLPQLEHPDLGGRMPGYHLGRLGHAGALDQIESGDLLLVSANGPSLTSTSPPRLRTVAAPLTDRSGSPCNRTPRRSISALQASTPLSNSVPSAFSAASSIQWITRYLIGSSPSPRAPPAGYHVLRLLPGPAAACARPKTVRSAR